MADEPTIRYAVQRPALRAALWLIDKLLAAIFARKPAPLPTDPARILVCIQAHLGDAILATAVLPPLRRAFPGARLGFLVHPVSAELLAMQPGVERVHRVEHWRLNRSEGSAFARWLRHRRSSTLALREIRRCRYDVAVDLYHHFPNSAVVMFRAGIPVRIGWSSAGFSPLLTHLPPDPGLGVNILDRHAMVLALLGVPMPAHARRPSLAVSESAAARWQTIAEAASLAPPYVAVHVGAFSAPKRWPAEKWCALVDALIAGGRSVVLLGHGPDDAALCRLIGSRCPQVVDCSNRLQLDELCAAIAASSLLVSHDSAAAHLGAAFDRPRVSLTTGINPPGMWLRATPRSVVMTKPVDCSPCLRSSGCATMDCIRGVEVADVLHTVDRLSMGDGPGRATGPSPHD